MITFTAKLYTIDAFLILHLPKEASAQLPSRGMVMVEGTINAVPFRFPLEPDGKGSHWMSLDKKLKGTLGVTSGDMVTVEIAPTKEWIEPDVPQDIEKAIAGSPQVHAVWQDITPMARWDWIRWIRATNNPLTREKHIAVALSKMQSGERRPCCFNRSSCTVPEVSKNGVLLSE